MREDLELARFQAVLLALLAQDLPADEVHRRLVQDPASRPFADYVAGFDLRCVEVAGRITRKFGKRTGQGAAP